MTDAEFINALVARAVTTELAGDTTMIVEPAERARVYELQGDYASQAVDWKRNVVTLEWVKPRLRALGRIV